MLNIILVLVMNASEILDLGSRSSLLKDLYVEKVWQLLKLLVGSGIYRITPLGDMYMRIPREPCDGIDLAAAFTCIVYNREREILLPGS